METVPAVTRRQRYIERYGALDNEYSTWRTTQEQICDVFQPGRGRFNTTDTIKGQRKDQSIVNDTGVSAGGKLAAAMDTGITSAAREWLRLASSTSDESKGGEARDYLHEVQRVFFEALARSNYYQTHRNIYRDVIGPGTGLMFIEEDEKDVVRFIHVPVGQYRLAVDSRGRVNTVYRGPFTMTVAQVVGEFGEDACSATVRNAWRNNKPDDPVQVLHVVEERTEREYGKIDAKNKPWGSCWMEYGGGPAGSKEQQATALGFLRESGYDEQPFVAPRWDVVGLDPYGRDSPGWQALGDARALQILEKNTAQSLALINRPPMNKPAGMANGSLIPGVNNIVPDGKSKYEPSVIIPTAAVTVGEEKIRRHEARIERAHFADVLFIISMDERAQRATAEEVKAKKDERLLLLGGVFSRLADEDLKPMVARVLPILQRRGLFPPPPEELGQGVTIEFQNILVSAQKTIQITSVERAIATATMVTQATGEPDAVDNLDPDEIVAMSVDMLGAPPKMLRTPEKRDAIRKARQQAAQAKAQGEAMAKAAPAVQAFSETDPEKLQQLLGPLANAQATA